MEIKRICQNQWSDVKSIYMEAFPKAERKPFFLLKRAAQKEKSEIWVASENGVVAGFIVLIPYRDMVLVEYLAVSNMTRSKGTGSKILGEICMQYEDKRILLLIEEIDGAANNQEQRIARKRFYLKNGFEPSGIFIQGVSGNMEILCHGGSISGDEFIAVQTHALGRILFGLSKTKVMAETENKEGEQNKMSESIIFREFKEADRSELEQVIRETWCYDRFCTPKTAAQLANVYLSSCLANQTYTQIALVDNVPVGIIMGKNRASHKCPFSLQLKKIKAIVKLMISKEGRSVSKIFGGINGIDKELLNLCPTNYQGELAFFAIRQNCRGKGIGKALFQKVVEYMRSQKIQNFYLFTDTSCNYGFYEHQGMKRKQEKKYYFDVNGLPEEMTFFLYDYVCD